MTIIKHIPNTITCLNLVSGAISIILSFGNDFRNAFLFMIAASVFDFLDGFAARGLKAYSDIGKELDSLCDTVSFGLAPSLFLYNYMQTIQGVIPTLTYVPLIIAVFSVLRLAKFNIDTRQSHSFIGLPTPACALLVGALMHYCTYSTHLSNILQNSYILPIFSVLRFFSLKFQNFRWEENKTAFSFIAITILTIVVLFALNIEWSGIVMYIFLLYI